MGFLSRTAVLVLQLQVFAGEAIRIHGSQTLSVNGSRTMGGCSLADLTIIDAKGSGSPSIEGTYPNIINTCASTAYSLLNGFQRQKFFECIEQKGLAVSDTCAKCIVVPVEYGASNCKALCAAGACSHMCQMCMKGASEQLSTCAGHPMPVLKCDNVPTSVTGISNGCSNADMAVVNQKGSGKVDTDGSYPNIVHTCASASYSMWKGFNQDAFKTCIKNAGLVVSDTCTTCITAPVLFGVDNCKTYCALGSCNDYCQMCTQDARAELPRCAGHDMPVLKC